MKRQEFLNILNSNKVSTFQRVFRSRYLPKSPEEIKLLSKKASIAHRDFQEQLLQIALRIRRNLAIPLLGELACRGLDRNIREQALDRLLKCPGPEARIAILICSNDEDPEIQKKALKGLAGSKDPRAIELLVDRLRYPESALLPNLHGEQHNILQSAIQGLATKHATEGIQPLVLLMLEHARHRRAIAETLAVIANRTAVIAGLLNAAEGRLKTSIKPDQGFKLEAVRIIASMELKGYPRAQLERYRILLGKVYTSALQNVDEHAYVLRESAKHLDDHLLRVIREGFKTHIANPAASKIIGSMRNSNLKKTEAFWLDAFEYGPQNLQGEIEEVFLELAQEDKQQVILFFGQALRSRGPKNKHDRLAAMTKKLDVTARVSIIRLLSPMLDEKKPREFLRSYFGAVWESLPKEELPKIVKALVGPSYETKQALDELALFLAPRCMLIIDEREPQKTVLDILREEWKREGQREKLEAILFRVAQQVSDVRKLCATLVKKASEDPRGEEWPFFENLLRELPNKEQIQAIQEILSQQWHRKLTAYLLDLNEDQTANILREHIARTGSDRLTGDDRVWALSILGKIGDTSDFELLENEIKGDSQACAAAAVKAIGEIDINGAQERLREALESRKPKVVLAALEALEGISQIQPDTVRALRERAGSGERDEKVRNKAQTVVDILKKRHLSSRPNPERPPNDIQAWLGTLEAFGQSMSSGKVIEEFLKSLGDRDAPEIRKSLAKSVSTCCPPDKGIEIAQNEANKERRAEIRVAWEDSLDSLKRHPDRSVFHLVERLAGEKLDRPGLLGKWGLEEIFQNPTETLIGLSTQLRHMERIKEDPDTLATNLDATAELLIDELLLANGDQPENFDHYANKIGKTKKICVKAHRQAGNLHTLRDIARGPHVRDATGAIREGLTPQEADDARRSFIDLFKETIRFLRTKKEKSS